LKQVDLSPLVAPREASLMAKIADYPDVLKKAAEELGPHQIAFYLRDLAGDLHSYYNAERVLVDDAALKEARLALSAGNTSGIGQWTGTDRCLGTVPYVSRV
jgi:arginyl-tRNA synthetase